MASTAALLCVLQNTLDPDEAARMADELGSHAFSVTPRVSFPGYWVLRQSSASATRAAYAVRHCSDPLTLSEVVAKDSRNEVLLALLENPDLSSLDRDKLKNVIAQRPTARANTWNTRLSLLAAKPTPWTFFDKLDNLRLESATAVRGLVAIANKRQIGNEVYRCVCSLLRDNPTPAAVDAALRTFAPLGGDLFIQEYLKSHFRTEAGTNHDIWDLATLTPVEVLALAPRQVSDDLLTLLATLAGLYPGLARPLDLDITKLIVSRADPANTVVYSYADRPPVDSFTPEALSYLLGYPQFAHVLVSQQLAPLDARELINYLDQNNPRLAEQFFAIRRCALDLMNPAKVVETINSSIGSAASAFTRDQLYKVRFVPRLMASALLASAAYLYIMRDCTDYLLNCCSGPDDPFLRRLSERASPHYLIDYLTGRIQLPDGLQILPTSSSVRELVSRIPYDLLAANVSVMVLPSTPGSHVEALADFFPRAAFKMLDDPRASRYVYTRLVAAAPDTAAALTMFDALSHSTLTSVCTTLAALNRSAVLQAVPV